jgi:hypothetical protein
MGSVPGPFRLSDVLVAPQMVHNLLSIRQFTADNSCSMEFDTSGLSVKDLATGSPLLRVTAPGPFTPFGFLSPLPPLHLRLLRKLLLP